MVFKKGEIMDKKTFLEKIKNAENKNPAKFGPAPKVDSAQIVSPLRIEGTACEAFIRNFKTNGGVIVESLPELIAILKEKNCKKGFVESAFFDQFNSDFNISDSFDKDNMDSYDFSVTKAYSAVGETGAFALSDNSTSDRLATIAPWVHVSILQKNTIEKTLSDWLAKIEKPYTILISGPSKTADVEGILIQGVHGPGTEIVFLQ